MSWTERSDEADCCPPPGACKNDEHVAKLLHTRIMQPFADPLKRDDLFGPKPPKSYSNECGVQDGMSVVRRNELSDDDVRGRSAKFVENKQNTEPQGAYVAAVAELRALKHESVPEGQLVYIYDDPTDDVWHAVVRCSQEVPRVQQDAVRNLVRKAFSTRIHQTPFDTKAAIDTTSSEVSQNDNIATDMHG